MITVTLSRDSVTPDLRRLLRDARADGALGAVLGRAGANVLRKHFRARNKTPNKLGGTRTNFWSRVAESVNAPRAKGKGVVIPVTHPAIAQKVFGGTLPPKKAKYLAIPVDARAHGKSPRVIPGLHFAANRKGTMMLALGKGADFKVLYILKKSVKQMPDRQALPPDRDVSAAMTSAANIFFRRRSTP